MGQHPIGVFDSGVGGLSILKALRAELPEAHLVYLADSAYAPYGERDEAFIIERARRITRYFVEEHHIELLVMACNTATAAAIEVLRQEFANLPIVGVEPALRPAALQSQTRRVGVLATRATLSSQKFKTLALSLSGQVEFICQPCDGLAQAIESQDTSKIIALCAEYTRATGRFGTQTGDIDTLVLGCTHYPFARPQLATLLGPTVQLIDNGQPVARQVRRLTGPPTDTASAGSLTLLATGSSASLQGAARQWLSTQEPVQPANGSGMRAGA